MQETKRDYAALWQPQDFWQAARFIDASAPLEEFWEWGKRYGEMILGMPGVRERISYLPTIVEYGCGLGRILDQIGVGAAWRFGVDVSPAMLEFARHGPARWFIHWLLSDGRSIPIADDTADLVYSWLVFQHMDAADVKAVLRETARCLSVPGVALHLFTRMGVPYGPDAVLPNPKPLQWDAQGIWCPGWGMMGYRDDDVRDVFSDTGLELLALVPVAAMNDNEAAAIRGFGNNPDDAYVAAIARKAG